MSLEALGEFIDRMTARMEAMEKRVTMITNYLQDRDDIRFCACGDIMVKHYREPSCAVPEIVCLRCLKDRHGIQIEALRGPKRPESKQPQSFTQIPDTDIG